jgi:hypothetical protein
MHRQQTLPLDGQEDLSTVWEQLPEESRRQVIRIYARLLAVAVQSKTGKEESNDKFEE